MNHPAQGDISIPKHPETGRNRTPSRHLTSEFLQSLADLPRSDLDHGVLRLIEAVIRALPSQQLLMVAVLDNLTVVDIADLVRILDGRQAMRNDEARTPLEQVVETGLQRLLGARIDIRSGLVKDQDPRIGE